MGKELLGAVVGGWTITALLGAGKSALVLKAEKESETCALKIFDPDLVEKHGEATQLRRIEREKRLVGKSHPHLVTIYDGGKCETTSHLFVAMELIPAKDLSQVLPSVPHDRIRPLIAQLAEAARYLHAQQLAHRDIKPSNIAISSDFQHLTLLDLGVLRPFGEVGLTDTEGNHFVGTLQYSSPEFLFRKEQDSPEGWLALAFYQIGAVLHDLLKKKPIFDEYQFPYARMVDAVKHTAPDLEIPGADPDLVALAKVCLVKDPELRVRLVNWGSFQPGTPPQSTASIRDRIKRNQASAWAESNDGPERLTAELELNEILGQSTTMIRAECLNNPEVFPQVEVHDHPSSDPYTRVFRAAFPRSSERSVSSPFAILFVIRLVDLAAKIVDVKVAGSLSSDVREFPHDAFSEPTPLYEGPFGNDRFKSSLEMALYTGLEVAIQHRPLPYANATPLKISVDSCPSR